VKNNTYLITPLLAWFVAGCLKFLINSIRTKKIAFALIGYGGLPSNHSAIVSSMVALIALNDGINVPAFGVAFTLAFIVLLDANSLRQAVGQHAVIINRLTQQDPEVRVLRERMGHNKIEILAGIMVGISVAFMIYSFSLGI